MPEEPKKEERFPDDRVDNERFTGAAAGWIGIVIIGCGLTFALLVIVLFILSNN